MPATETAFQLFDQGNDLMGAGEITSAADCYRRALLIDPALSAARYNLGCALDALAGPAQALPHFLKAASERPSWWQARSNLGFALARVGRMAEAVRELEAAAQLNPDDAGTRNNLGLALTALGRGEEAHRSFLDALRLNPRYPEAHNNLAILFERYGRTSEAISSCREALALRPDYPEAHHNLANALKSQGSHNEALAHYREALRLKPEDPELHSSLLFALCYAAGMDAARLLAEHRAFGAAHRRSPVPYDNVADPGKPLRIGYLSADFRDHAVARFIEPVLRCHDRSRFEAICYSNVSVPDATSARLWELAGRLVNIAGIPDREAAELIRSDRIDILVDLSGHTAGNRLPLFALKPAPVQVSWIGYPATTGLDTMDYRITDAVCDPPGETERFHTERLLRLPDSFSCFAPGEDAPPVSCLPARATGRLTFGSFNNPAKITSETVELWAGALLRVPGSRMLVKGYSLADRGSRARLFELFAARGISSDRLELRGNTPGYREHLELYASVDIALDSYPYHGTTTTCEALWMGVPVVTLCGDAHRSRVGASILKRVGLADLAVSTPHEFGERAAELAQDLERLAQLRGALRQAVAASPLVDGVRFTKGLEATFRSIWQAWCAEAKGTKTARPAVQPALSGQQALPAQQPLPVQPAQQAQPAPSDQSDQPGQPERSDRKPRPAVAVTGAPGNPAAKAERFLEHGKLDEAVTLFLEALSANPSDGAPLGGIEVALNELRNLELSEAVRCDAARLGVMSPPALQRAIADTTLEQAGVTLLALGFLTPADLICRYLLDRGHRSPLLSRTLGEIALALDLPAAAAGHFRDALALGDGRRASIQLVKAEAAARCRPQRPPRERFLIIKAWGYGFWSDVNHLLGQCLLAEMTGRTPVVDWGSNSLFCDDPAANAFDSFFEPISGLSARELAATCRSFHPPKWNALNLTQPVLNQSDGPWSRASALHTLERGEDVVVSDFHYAVHDLVPWIAPGHPLAGMTTDAIYLHLFRRYLKVKPALAARAEAFFQTRLSGAPHLALHIRGGDKGGEDPNLALLNSLYPLEIERYLREHPDGRLFLITDDRQILASYRQRYADRLVHTVATRTDNEAGVHYQNQLSRRLLGEEVLVDALIAAHCPAFVGNGLSNVSCAVAQMKPWPAGSCRLLGARLDRLRNLTLYRS